MMVTNMDIMMMTIVSAVLPHRMLEPSAKMLIDDVKTVKIVTIMTVVMVMVTMMKLMTITWGTGNTLANRSEGGKTTIPGKGGHDNGHDHDMTV